MLIIFVMVVAAVGVLTFLSPKWYRSEVDLYASSSQILKSSDTQTSYRDRVLLQIGTLRTILTSDHVLASAMLRLDGDKPVEVKDVPADDVATAVAAAQRQGHVDQWDAKVNKFIDENRELLKDFQNRLAVVAPDEADALFTQTVTVRVDWPEQRELAAKLGRDSLEMAAEKASLLVGHLVQAYGYRYSNIERSRMAEASRQLEAKSLQVAEEELAAADNAFQKYVTKIKGPGLLQLKHMLESSPGYETGKASLATRYSGELTVIDTEMARLRSLKLTIDTQLAKPADSEMVVPDAISASNPSLTTLQDSILKLKMRIDLLTTRTDDHRVFVDVRRELELARESLRAELGRQVESISQELVQYQAKKDVLEASLAADRKLLVELGGFIPEYESLEARRNIARRQYESVKQRLTVAAVAKALALADTTIVVSTLGRPTKPDPSSPRRPNMILNMSIAVICGLILSLIYAFMANHLDHSFKSIDDAEKFLGVPVLASVPKLGRHVVCSRRGAK